MTHVQNCRIFIRPNRAYSEAKQLDTCMKVAGLLGAPVSVYVAGQHTRAGWISALRRDEVAIVTRLDFIAEPRKAIKGRPVVAFNIAVGEVRARCLYILEADTGITSDDRNAFAKAIEAASNRIAQGRPLGKAKAKQMAEKRWKGRAFKGVVDKWLSPHMREERERLGSIWYDRVQYTGAQAVAKIAELTQGEIKTDATARRIWEPRTQKPTRAKRKSR